ncbi:MAG: GNAT family N-acetyltransferase [Eubacteriaceae bacterium]
MVNYKSDVEDVYFNYKYAKLCELIEHGKAEKYIFENENGVIYYQYIKRLIPVSVDDIDYYDIITPYGYGGPLIIRCIQGKQAQLINEFNKSFISKCKENRIVSEFIRFHPILKNYMFFKDIYNPIFLRNTVAINLSKKDILMDEFSRSCRNKVRKGKKSSVNIEFDFNCNSIDAFYDIYIETMKKNNASNFYFFPLDYFKYAKNHLKDYFFIVNARLDSKIIASSIFLHTDNYLHWHLGGTLPNYYCYASDNLILYEVAKWGKKTNKKYIHLGGGFTNSEDDGLFIFKKSFTKDTVFDFYIGKRILNQNIYDLLTIKKRKNKREMHRDFFPEYRA